MINLNVNNTEIKVRTMGRCRGVMCEKRVKIRNTGLFDSDHLAGTKSEEQLD